MTRITQNFDQDIAKFTPRQMDAVRVMQSGNIKFMLYGGALGGGKSYFLRWYTVRRLMQLASLGFKEVTANRGAPKTSHSGILAAA